MRYTVKEMPCQSGKNNIYGLIYLPEGVSERMPVVILSHGYNSSYSHVADMAEAIAEKGMAAYCYDFCGGSTISKSGGSSLDMSIATEQEDLRNVIRMIKDCDFSDNEKIFLYGESQGGFVSALTGAEMKDDIAGMALLYPAFCIPDNWLSKNAEDMTEPVDFMGMKLSAEFRRGVPEYDVFKAVSAFDKPVLLLHGDSDSLVDISYSERLSEAFPDCCFEVYENEGHGFSPEARKRICERVPDFFAAICSE
ncbi:MAG: alpha/beta hydrolase family protein [Oscillospiraceae bacterium]